MNGYKFVKENNLKESDFKANICDSVEIITDFSGITESQFKLWVDDLNDVLSPQMYSRYDDELMDNEVNSYGNRRRFELSKASRLRYIKSENVVRYIAKSKQVMVSVSRFFACISLSYKNISEVNAMFELMKRIIDKVMSFPYFKVEQFVLKKKYGACFLSLYRMYQCLNKQLFGDVSYNLLRNTELVNDSGYTRSYNSFTYRDVDAIIDKEIKAGEMAGTHKSIYEGTIEISVSQCSFYKEGKVDKLFHQLNDISYELFVRHITKKFAEELYYGNSKKVLSGVHCHE